MKKRVMYQHILNLILKKSVSLLGMAALMVFCLFPSTETNAAYYSEASITGNEFATTCWTQPTAPNLLSLPDDSEITNGDPWLTNSLMDWEPSGSRCPSANLQYQFQVATTSNFADGSIVQTSSWIADTEFTTSANAEGEYYWRVFVRDQAHLSIEPAVSVVFNYTVDLVSREETVQIIDGPEPSSEQQSLVAVPEFAQTVVLNEITPDPVGDDNAALPGGEWVELYNRTSDPIDVNGWVIYADAGNQFPLVVSTSNAFEELAIGSGTTIIQPSDFLVVYRAGNANFDLKNIPVDGPADTEPVRLFDKLPSVGGVLQDEHVYTMSSEDKSHVRNPDGFGAWVDPIPSPGRPNILEVSQITETILHSGQQDDQHLVVALNNALKYQKAEVNIYYLHEVEGQEVQEALTKLFDITQNTQFFSNIFLGTDSAGTLNPHTNIKDVEIEVTLTGEGEQPTVLHSSIAGWSSE